jgi:hypothetical protein
MVDWQASTHPVNNQIIICIISRIYRICKIGYICIICIPGLAGARGCRGRREKNNCVPGGGAGRSKKGGGTDFEVQNKYSWVLNTAIQTHFQKCQPLEQLNT